MGTAKLMPTHHHHLAAKSVAPENQRVLRRSARKSNIATLNAVATSPTSPLLLSKELGQASVNWSKDVPKCSRTVDDIVCSQMDAKCASKLTIVSLDAASGSQQNRLPKASIKCPPEQQKKAVACDSVVAIGRRKSQRLAEKFQQNEHPQTVFEQFVFGNSEGDRIRLEAKDEEVGGAFGAASTLASVDTLAQPQLMEECSPQPDEDLGQFARFPQSNDLANDLSNESGDANTLSLNDDQHVLHGQRGVSQHLPDDVLNTGLQKGSSRCMDLQTKPLLYTAPTMSPKKAKRQRVEFNLWEKLIIRQTRNSGFLSSTHPHVQSQGSSKAYASAAESAHPIQQFEAPANVPCQHMNSEELLLKTASNLQAEITRKQDKTKRKLSRLQCGLKLLSLDGMQTTSNLQHQPAGLQAANLPKPNPSGCKERARAKRKLLICTSISTCARTRVYTKQQREGATSSSSTAAAQHRRFAIYAEGTELPDESIARMLRFNREFPCITIVGSSIAGLGAVATRPIGKLEPIIEYVGELISLEEADRRELVYQGIPRYHSDCYMFRLDNYRIIDATRCGSASRFVNHSCTPNCVAWPVFLPVLRPTQFPRFQRQRAVVIFAARDIREGEELCYDYGFAPDREPEKRLRCFCGSPQCRGWMS